jgi:hypothetical protein
MVVVLFCIGCLTILVLGQRVARLPVVGRSDRLHAVYRRAADTTRLTRSTFVAGFLLLGCWTSPTLGSTLLLSALGVGFSPALAMVVLCMSAATAILPITAGGAVVGVGTTTGLLFALGVTKGAAGQFRVGIGTPADQRRASRRHARTQRVASHFQDRSGTTSIMVRGLDLQGIRDGPGRSRTSARGFEVRRSIH